MTTTVTRTLAQLLSGSGSALPHARAFFYDEARLRRAAQRADRILYSAQRDACRPRTVTTVDGTRLRWRLDRVRYASADLPTGELNRSVGHWNAPDQWEIFEVERGEVAMVVAVVQAGLADVVRCQPGGLVCVRPGSWHLTYVLRGPAVVSNAYSAPVPAAGGEQAMPKPKYFTRPTARLGLRRSGDQVTVFADPPWRSRDWRQAPNRADLVGGLDSLADVFTAAHDHRLLTDPAGLTDGLLPDLVPGTAGRQTGNVMRGTR